MDNLNELCRNVSKLSSLVDYQAGAVMSRTVLNQKTGSITLFSLDRGQALSEHTALLCLCLHCRGKS